MALDISKSYTPPQTLWKSIISLAVLEGIITIGWLAYEKYQPILLKEFEYTFLASWLIIAQGLLGAIFHPISGKMADGIAKKQGHKFPIIIAGIAFAAIIFMAVSLTYFASAKSSIAWILPVLVILWLAAMSTFHSPAVSLVESFAPVENFPKVAAILSMSFGIIYALEPFIIPILNFLGIGFVFILGGGLLLVAGITLRNVNLKEQSQSHKSTSTSPHPTSYNPIHIVGLGLGVGLFKSMILFAIPSQLASFWQLTNDDYVQAGILFCSVLVSLPIGKWITQNSTSKGLWLGIILASLASILSFVSDIFWLNYLLIAVSGVAFGFLTISALPMVLHKTASHQSGWGIGLYYGGISASAALVNWILFVY